MKRYYAGIGSRETPADICDIMRRLATVLEEQGFILRSGGASGADQAFQSGVETEAHIYLPWASFEAENTLKYPQHKYSIVGIQDGQAENSVKIFHPNYERLSNGGKALMRRNYRQVVGRPPEPDSSFVVCWTKGGGATGGTAQAIRIADSLGIPVLNLWHEEHLKKVQRIIN